MQERATTSIHPIYAVTWGIMDTDAGANPLGWHTFVAFSKWNNNTQWMEAEATWGFYGVPATESDDCTGYLKGKIGLGVDIMGNHAFLRREDNAILTAGKGLHGKMIALPVEKYIESKNKFEMDASFQNEAIREIAEEYQLTAVKKYRIYPYEKHSQFIYQKEREKAEKEKRPSRLHHFGLKISMSKWGPSISESQNCKTHAIRLLTGILTKEQIDALVIGPGTHPVIPKSSGKLGYFTFFSTGSFHERINKSGDRIYYRANDNDVTTYMIPPHIVSGSETTCASVKMPENEYQEANKIIATLQQIEQLFLNTRLSPADFSLRKQYMLTIAEYYKVFATIKPDKSKSSMRDSIKKANAFIDKLYTSSPLTAGLSTEGKNALRKIIEKFYYERFEENHVTNYCRSHL